MLNLIGTVDITTSKAILEAIEQRATTRWGSTWRAKIAQEYARIGVESGSDPDATYDNRRRQIYKVFESYSCTLETAIALAAAVGCKFQMSCTEVKVDVINF